MLKLMVDGDEAGTMRCIEPGDGAGRGQRVTFVIPPTHARRPELRTGHAWAKLPGDDAWVLAVEDVELLPEGAFIRARVTDGLVPHCCIVCREMFGLTNLSEGSPAPVWTLTTDSIMDAKGQLSEFAFTVHSECLRVLRRERRSSETLQAAFDSGVPCVQCRVPRR